MSMREIYEKYVNGDRHTDKELEIGSFFYLDLADKLSKAGPVFTLAAREADRVGQQLESYLQSRRGNAWKRAFGWWRDEAQKQAALHRDSQPPV